MLVDDVRAALYASKICPYAQGMNLIRAKSSSRAGTWTSARWRLWKGGCIIRARFLDRIKQAYDKDADLPSLLVDGEFAAELVARNDGWRRRHERRQRRAATPSMSGSLAYFDSYRRGRCPRTSCRRSVTSSARTRTSARTWRGTTVWSDELRGLHHHLGVQQLKRAARDD